MNGHALRSDVEEGMPSGQRHLRNSASALPESPGRVSFVKLRMGQICPQVATAQPSSGHLSVPPKDEVPGSAPASVGLTLPRGGSV